MKTNRGKKWYQAIGLPLSYGHRENSQVCPSPGPILCAGKKVNRRAFGCDLTLVFDFLNFCTVPKIQIVHQMLPISAVYLPTSATPLLPTSATNRDQQCYFQRYHVMRYRICFSHVIRKITMKSRGLYIGKYLPLGGGKKYQPMSFGGKI
jgi:hypothetical protein